MLLVGGDSFAQFPNGGYGYRDDEIHDVELPDYHWCQSIDADAKSVGLGSADISASTFLTISQLSKGDYSHCIFFITSPTREILNKDLQTIDSYIDCVTDKNDSLSLENRFRDPRHTIPHNTGSSYIETNSNAIFFQAGGEFNGKEYHKNAIETTHGPMAIHNKVSNLLALKHYCDSNKIKLMLVAPFGPDAVNVAISKFYKLDVFYYMKWVFGSFEDYIAENGLQVMNLRTHHTTKEHDRIFNAFNVQYPQWMA
jgi:hypothetical protein